MATVLIKKDATMFRPLLILVFLIFNAQAYSATCPIKDLGETELDCPWASIARTLKLEKTENEIIKALYKAVPILVEQLKQDASRKELKALWGQSINYDEYAKGTIVEPTTLAALATMAAVDFEDSRIVHAGLEHTYGYLFSLLRTPFGYKRARWVKDDIETGFGLPRGALGPSPVAGTLLTNITCFAGRIALNDSLNKAVLEECERIAAPSVASFDFSKISITRLEESLRVDRLVRLRTDFAFFPVQNNKLSALLVYSIDDEAYAAPKLVTAFPVEQTFVDRAVDGKGLGSNRVIVTRYNAFVNGLTNSMKKLIGTRKAWMRTDHR
ncbi:MAG: hypothetical protein A3K03_04990 [Bdellovibrionales bacterium RIFOXYD1_FULL_44_7]|nr:MAG: hypothetical protein A3K03_04990 [Bdellovibrionales bacterium RIFOXYD1_FULL_44_7]